MEMCSGNITCVTVTWKNIVYVCVLNSSQYLNPFDFALDGWGVHPVVLRGQYVML